MGWSGGSQVLEAVVSAVQANVPDEEARYQIYGPIYDRLRDMDWDSMDECVGQDPALDRVIAEDIGDEAVYGSS